MDERLHLWVAIGRVGTARQRMAITGLKTQFLRHRAFQMVCFSQSDPIAFVRNGFVHTAQLDGQSVR
ncbi:hypothetical protein BRX37_05580 [Sphingomonas sp. S-NIH.Pt3_0716]|uniref:Uncharacterized protein n=1 Tax=Sphingobium yanoikuyae TaxID=13690 RepID=A0A291MYU6_SPHYA|nr:hypothetical protein A6768_09780 [Sphingobium yanoikuyae]RSU54939.1 hypothetical protein DAH51_18510 [Sphingobium yanoikuyae]RSU77975.1 hypothetical protein BRX37_05580 [Sphingomonas sp. S-NIH.Pt3_0716]